MRKMKCYIFVPYTNLGQVFLGEFSGNRNEVENKAFTLWEKMKNANGNNPIKTFTEKNNGNVCLLIK